MDMQKPTAGHAKLETLAGVWVGEETMHPSQWDPKGGVAQGHTESRMALSGFALVSDYRQERDGVVTFTGHGVWTYDSKAELYTLHWFDCMGSPPEVFQGRFEGAGIVMAHGGPGMHARMTYDLTDPRRMKCVMQMSQDGREWKTLFDGWYEKQ